MLRHSDVYRGYFLSNLWRRSLFQGSYLFVYSPQCHCSGFCLCRAKPQICLCSGKSKFSLHRSVEVFCTREKAAFRWGLFRSKPFPRRLHLRVCPRLLPLLPRITLTTLTTKIQKKRKSLCIWWKKRQAIILCLSLVLGILNLFLTLGFKRRNLFPNGMS